MVKKLKKELVYFSFIGFLAVAFDFVLYNFFNFLGFKLYFSKGLSFLGGAFLSYVCNKKYTFKMKKNSSRLIYKFSLIYLSSLFLNVITNNLIYYFANSYTYIYFFSFLVATTISALYNFFGLKLFVFKK